MKKNKFCLKPGDKVVLDYGETYTREGIIISLKSDYPDYILVKETKSPLKLAERMHWNIGRTMPLDIVTSPLFQALKEDT